MHVETSGTSVNVTLGEEDVYQGHHQSEDGIFGVHEFLVKGALPMKIYKHFAQILVVHTHEGWALQFRGDGTLVTRPPWSQIEEQVKAGATMHQAAHWQPVPVLPEVPEEDSDVPPL